jgi:hypothetical protein
MFASFHSSIHSKRKVLITPTDKNSIKSKKSWCRVLIELTGRSNGYVRVERKLAFVPTFHRASHG